MAKNRAEIIVREVDYRNVCDYGLHILSGVKEPPSSLEIEGVRAVADKAELILKVAVEISALNLWDRTFQALREGIVCSSVAYMLIPVDEAAIIAEARRFVECDTL